MTKKNLVIAVFSMLMMSCSLIKNVANDKNNKATSKVDKIVANALQYKGVKYKFGGTTKKGMDCSGLIYVAFKEENTPLPRVSRAMAKTGEKISLSEVQKGDLLFFKTTRRAKSINHVGLVVAAKNGEIRFVHATSSKGVIVSSLAEKYWKNAFVKANKVL